MHKQGTIEIRITGFKGNIKLEPDNYDIKEIISVLQNMENMLFPGEKKDRPTISYRIEEGSVIHRFLTGLQIIIGFNAVLGQINESQSIDFLEPDTANAFEEFQKIAIKTDYEFNITTSISNSSVLKINKSTHYFRIQPVWNDAEFYFYGKITNMGGKGRSNFHISTDNQGVVIIETTKEFIEQYELNPVYKTFGIRAVGKQNIQTGEIDRQSLKFVELIPYEPVYDESYLFRLRNRAKKNLELIKDPDQWVNEIRGY